MDMIYYLILQSPYWVGEVTTSRPYSCPLLMLFYIASNRILAFALPS